MSTIKFWLIRHKPTGGYLPEPAGRMGRGGSHVEPVLHTEDPATTPRIFSSERAAKNALVAWLRGKYVAKRGRYAGGPDSIEEYYEDVEIVGVPSRKREEMEIISADLVLP